MTRAAGLCQARLGSPEEHTPLWGSVKDSRFGESRERWKASLEPEPQGPGGRGSLCLAVGGQRWYQGLVRTVWLRMPLPSASAHWPAASKSLLFLPPWPGVSRNHCGALALLKPLCSASSSLN